MALGLGQLAGGLLLGNIFGGLLDQNKDQQPTQVASNTPQQGGGGFLGGISNQMFQGMSPEQVARLGMGFNTMRLDPDESMASSFQRTIDTSIANKKLLESKNSTIDWLRNRKSDKFPNGRVDLVDMVDNNIVSPAEAVSMALNVVEPSSLQEKFNKFSELKLFYGGADKIPPLELQLLGLTQNEVNSIEEYEYYKENLKDGETAIEYLDFLQLDAPQTNVTVDIEGNKIVEENAFWKAYNAAAIPDIIDWEVKSADTKGNIVKLMEALDSLSDPNALLTGPIIGQMPDFIMAFLNPQAIDTREAIEAVVQRNLKAVLGGQFTEREGEKLIKRAYNPTLSHELNAKRLRILIEQMVKAAEMQDARSAWIRDPANNGSLRGFTGKLPTLNDFYSALSVNTIGDVVCDSGTDNKDRKCYTYQGGDDKLESNWKLVE